MRAYPPPALCYTSVRGVRRRTTVVTRPLRLGVVGCGAIAQMMHLPTLAERPDLFAIAGLADIDRATLDLVAARYHVERTTRDYHELLAHDDVEAVLVLASGTHRPFVTAALAAGKRGCHKGPVSARRQHEHRLDIVVREQFVVVACC